MATESDFSPHLKGLVMLCVGVEGLESELQKEGIEFNYNHWKEPPEEDGLCEHLAWGFDQNSNKMRLLYRLCDHSLGAPFCFTLDERPLIETDLTVMMRMSPQIQNFVIKLEAKAESLGKK